MAAVWMHSVPWQLYGHIVLGIILGGNSSNSGKNFTLQNKISELWPVHNPESHVDVNLNS